MPDIQQTPEVAQVVEPENSSPEHQSMIHDIERHIRRNAETINALVDEINDLRSRVAALENP